MLSEFWKLCRWGQGAGFRLVSFPDNSQSVEASLVHWTTFLVAWGGAIHQKECHICIFKSGTQVSEVLVHIEYYTAPLTKSLKWLQGLLGQPQTGCETSIHYLQFDSKLLITCHAKINMASHIRIQLHPVWLLFCRWSRHETRLCLCPFKRALVSPYCDYVPPNGAFLHLVNPPYLPCKFLDVCFVVWSNKIRIV